MPRPNKPINPGKTPGYLDEPASSSRSHSWSKHSSPSSATEAPDRVEVTVDDVTIVTTPPEGPTGKYEQRGMAGHAGALDVPPDEAVVPGPRTRQVKRWVVDRTVDGRAYRRTDAAYFVDEPIDAPEAAS